MRRTPVEAAVAHAFETLAPAGTGDRGVLVAVSGGIDSLCLADAALRLAPEQRLEVAIAHVDHGLRGEESTGDRHFVERFARSRGAAFHFEIVDPATEREGRSSRERPSVQEAARSLRYAALERMRHACGAAWIATAHNADDQAETLLLRLLRGAAPESLAGIPALDRERRLLRPVLSATREQIEAHARERGIEWREDSSNASDDYTRNRLRHHWLPELAREFNPQLLRSLANFADAMTSEQEWLRSLVASEAPRWFHSANAASERADAASAEELLVVASGWDELPETLARRLVRWALIEMGIGRDVSRRHVERVLAFLGAGPGAKAAPGRVLELPAGVRLHATRSEFRLLRETSSGAEAPRREAREAPENRRSESASLRPC